MLSTVYNTLFSSNETLTNTTQPSSHTPLSNCVCKSTENLVQFLTNRVAALERRLLEVEDKTKYMTNPDDEDLPELVTDSESEVDDEDLPELVLSDFEDEEYLPENYDCECDDWDCDCDCDGDGYECDAETCECPWNVTVCGSTTTITRSCLN